jgi:WD40 repeat protein
VALKVLPPQAAARPDLLERFQREARAAARLHHTNIVPVFGVGASDGVHFYAMQFIPGRGLDVLLRDRLAPPAAPATAPLATEVTPRAPDTSAPAARLTQVSAAGGAGFWREVARLGVQAAEALAYAHGQGVLHRDVKPSNLLVDDAGTLWVTDFGLAKVEGADDLTGTGDVVGTLRYMAPERFRGQADARSDVFSLGLTLYEVLTGRPAFDERDRVQLIERVSRGAEPVPLRQAAPAVPRDLERVVLKAMAREPEQRYAGAAELADDLRRFLADEPVRAGRPSLGYRLGKFLHRNRGPVLAAGIIMTVLLVGIAGTSTGWLQALVAMEDALEKQRQADEKKQVAEKTLDALALANAETGKALEKERWSATRTRLTVANQAWWLNHVDQADRVLDECDASGRGLEWHYLKRRCHAYLASFRAEVPPDTHHATALSPDCQRLAFMDAGKGTTIWDLTSGRVLLSVDAPAPFPHRTVAFSPDGRRVALGGKEPAVWDVDGRQRLLPLVGHRGEVGALAYSADGKFLGSVSRDQTVKIWDADTGKVLLTFGNPKAPVLTTYSGTLKFSPDGRYVASGGAVGGVKVWERATGRVVATVFPRNLWHTLAFSADGMRVIVGAGKKTAHVWDLTTGKEEWAARDDQHPVAGVAFSPDGQRVATTSVDGACRVHDAATGKPLFTAPPEAALEGGKDSFHPVAFSPDGRWLADASHNETVRVWDAATGRRLAVARGQAETISQLVFSTDGTRLAASGLRTAKVWAPTDGQESVTLNFGPDRVEHLDFNAAGTRLATVGGSGKTVRVWDAETGRQVQTFPVESFWVRRLAYAAGDRLEAVMLDDQRVVRQRQAVLTGRELTTGQGLSSLDVTGFTAGGGMVVFSPDGGRVATTATNRQKAAPVKVWDVQTGRGFPPLAGLRELLHGLAFSPDGRRLAAWYNPRPTGGTIRGLIQVWDVEAGAHRFDLADYLGVVTQVVFSSDGKYLAAALADQTVRLWDAATGKEVRVLRGHTAAVYCVTFSRDGKRMASGGVDRTVRLWETATGQETLTLRGHGDSVRQVLFSADGARLASAADDGTIRIWDGSPWQARPSEVVHQAEAKPRPQER